MTKLPKSRRGSGTGWAQAAVARRHDPVGSLASRQSGRGRAAGSTLRTSPGNRGGLRDGLPVTYGERSRARAERPRRRGRAGGGGGATCSSLEIFALTEALRSFVTL